MTEVLPTTRPVRRGGEFFITLAAFMVVVQAAKRVFDAAYYMYYGSNGHYDVIYSEAYRREGHFIFDQLPN